MEKTDLSRREQNRLDAYRGIHRAAFRMTVLENSVPTVEEIAASAGVSSRTLFNYFRSKEEAVIGLRQPKLTQVQRELLAQQSTTRQLDAVVLVLFDVIRNSIVDRAHFLERAVRLKSHADYRLNISRHLGACETVVLEGLAQSRGISPTSDDFMAELGERSRALVSIAGSVARFTFATHPEAVTEESSEHVRATLTLFRQVMKETL